MKAKYNKLVRDRIPELIRSQGEIPETRILNGAEFAACLEEKLDEEVAEFHRDKNAEELADILEVVFALGRELGWAEKELLALREDKRQRRGGFSRGIYLIGKE